MKIIKKKWDLSLLLASEKDGDIEKQKREIASESYKFINKWKERTDYLSDPSVLKEALDDYENWQRNWGVDGKIGFYFSLKQALNENDPETRAKHNQIIEFGRKILNDIQFFELKLAKIGADAKQTETFLKYAPLKPYKHFLERLFETGKYNLSEAEEKIVNLKSQTSYGNWVRMTSGLLAKQEREVKVETEDRNKNKYQTKKLAFSEIGPLLFSQDKKIRDSAGRAIDDISAGLADVAENEINSIMADLKVEDELRRRGRPDLGRHLADDIDSGVVDAMIAAVSGQFGISRRFYELFAKLLKSRRISYYDRSVAYGKMELKYTFEDCVELVSKVFRKLDPKFAEIFSRFLEQGQVDVYPSSNKHGGAFCSAHLVTNPVFVLLNYSNKLSDVLTIAHEFGHAINDELSAEKQNALNFGTPLSTAEVASTFMEDFVLSEIMHGADEELKLSLMVMKLQADVGTIFRQVSCYRFEQVLHSNFRQKGYLSKEEIGDLFVKNMSLYLGPAVKIGSGQQNWWVQWPHIREFFYVYSYASGLIISKYLQARVREDAKFMNSVKEFLAAGSSDSPNNIFLKLGIDISDKKFWEKGLSEIEKLLLETEKLARKLGKI